MLGFKNIDRGRKLYCLARALGFRYFNINLFACALRLRRQTVRASFILRTFNLYASGLPGPAPCQATARC